MAAAALAEPRHTRPAPCDPSAITELSAIVALPGGRRVTVLGRMTGQGAPVLALGGISSCRRLTDAPEGAGWWRGVASPGGALDPESNTLLSMDFLGEEAAPFPTVDDQARAALALADAAGIDRFAVCGASYGGQVALSLASLAPERVTTLAVIAASHRCDPKTQALRSIQRDMVSFAIARGDGRGGLDLARRLAMTTYRTRDELRDRFADPKPGSRDCAGVEAYLAARGNAYAASTSPERFLALSRSMDAVEIDLEAISAPTRVLAIEEDDLVPLEDVQATAEAIGARFETASSLYGHDAFLKAHDAVNRFLKAAL